jgi:hypothetical protein
MRRSVAEKAECEAEGRSRAKRERLGLADSKMTVWGTAGSGTMGSSRGSRSGLGSSVAATGDLILSARAYADGWQGWFATREMAWKTFG